MNTDKRWWLIRRMAFSLLMLVVATLLFLRLHWPGYLGIVVVAPILAGGGLSLYVLVRTLMGRTAIIGREAVSVPRQRRHRVLFVVGALLGAVLTALGFVLTFARIR